MQEELTLYNTPEGFALDDPSWILSRAAGYSPIQSLVSAVGACSGYVYQDVLKRSNVPFELGTIKVSYTRNMEAVSQPIQSISVIFLIKVSSEYQRKAETAVKIVSKYCPVIQSLDKSIDVNESVVFI